MVISKGQIDLTAIIMISLMILVGLMLMLCAIFIKKKDLDNFRVYGAELLDIVVNLVFAVSNVTVKRILIFIFGFLWTGLFLYFLITGKY